MLLSILITLQMLSSCKSEAAYAIFPGFDMEDDSASVYDNVTKWTTDPTFSLHPTNLTTVHPANLTTTKKKHIRRVFYSSQLKNISTAVGNFTVTDPLEARVKFTCPEDERASNIGPYEIPTRRDLVLVTIKTLRRLFARYQIKTMTFLDDITKVVIATQDVEKHCPGNKETYRKCVKHVTSKCETITKDLMASLEQQRQDLLAFEDTANTVCSIEAMKDDPMKLIKFLASEIASLEFALPGFLRLLHACSTYCISLTSSDKFKAVKPSRHLTDQDVVIRHFLTKKNYKRIIVPERSERPKMINAQKIAILNKKKQIV